MFRDPFFWFLVVIGFLLGGGVAYFAGIEVVNSLIFAWIAAAGVFSGVLYALKSMDSQSPLNGYGIMLMIGSAVCASGCFVLIAVGVVT